MVVFPNSASKVKTVRFWLIVMSGAVALAALILTAALLPAVQRWAVLRVAAGRPGLKLEIEHLAIRPGIAEIHNLTAEQSGVRVVVTDGRFEISLWQALIHRRLVLAGARVDGMRLDLTASGPPAVAPGGTAAHETGRTAPAARGLRVLPGFGRCVPARRNRGRLAPL